MGIIIQFAILMFFAALTKVVPRNRLFWIPVAWGGFSVVVVLLSGITAPVVFAIIGLKGFVMYFWVYLLKNFEDTVFMYLFILVVGGILLTIF